MPTKKASTSYRLTEEARKIIDRWSGRLGLSHAAVIDAALRQFDRWLSNAPPPGGLRDDLLAALTGLNETVRSDGEKKPVGRPRKSTGRE